jgi:N-carbamoylputrescine amidase
MAQGDRGGRLRDLDMDMVRKVRNSWQFYRDRRPDSYVAIAKP